MAWARTTTCLTVCNAATTLTETTLAGSAPSASKTNSASLFPLLSLSLSFLLLPLLSDPTSHPLPSPPLPPQLPLLLLPLPPPSPSTTPPIINTTLAELASLFSCPRRRRRSPLQQPPIISFSSAANPPPLPEGTTPWSSTTMTTTSLPLGVLVPGRETAFGLFSISLPNHPKNSTPRASETTTLQGSLPLTQLREVLVLSSLKISVALVLLSRLTLLSNKITLTVPTPLLPLLLLLSARFRDLDLLGVAAEASLGTSSRESLLGLEIALSGGWNLSVKVSLRGLVVAPPP